MIAYLEGRLVQSWGNFCILVTGGGVGYQLALPEHAFASLPARGEAVAFYTYLNVREDAQELFGFATFEERETFAILRGISKVGPRTALAILSHLRPEELAQVIETEDQAALARISGIGPKTAQHILLELRYKFKGRRKSLPRAAQPQSSALMDVLAAMANLGYAEGECGPFVRELFRAEPDLDVASAIRKALAALRARADGEGS